jgi:aminoglycoside phosphotransferase (APT) family kinase protein
MSTRDAEVVAARPGEELDLHALAAYLRERAVIRSGDLSVMQFPHGHSNLTYLLRCGTEEWVLRRPPFGNQVKSAHDMGREFRVLSGLSPIFPAAPRPLALCTDESILGAPFYVMERRRGLIVRREWPSHLPRDPELLREMCGALIDALADLHAIDPREAGLETFGKPAGYVKRQVEGWTKRYGDAETDQIPEMGDVSAWLAAKLPAESGVAIIHNDFKFDNIAFDPDNPRRVATVLDWEMATIGDPLMDLGSTLGYWVEASEAEELAASFVGPTWLPGAMTRQELIDRYAERRGLQSSDMQYYRVFGLFKIAVIVQQIYARFKRGLTHDPRFETLDASVRSLARQAALEIAA